MTPDRFDVAVIGAGFGGLAAALRLAELGARVVVSESLVYPGGCAGTFTRGGARFEAGATVVGGFGPGHLFDRWRRDHALPIEARTRDPWLELRWPGGRLPVDADRARFAERLDRQRRAADPVWALLAEPELLPPLGLGALLRHAGRLPAYARLLPLLRRPLGALIPADAPEALRLWIEAGCRISVQCGAEEAEALPALAALDWWWRGVAHVRGGVGALAEALVGAIRGLGGEVRLADRVRALEPAAEGWRLTARSGRIEARQVVANVLPADLAALLGRPVPGLDRLDRAVRTGWGAVTSYAVAREPVGAPASGVHLQLVDDARSPLVEGNHVFASVSAADDGFAPAGLRTITLSTHADLRSFPTSEEGRAERVEAVQERLRATFVRHAPEWADWTTALPGSPRTFQRFVRRGGGWVGGVPARVGAWPPRGVWPRPLLPGLWLVGDSVFPGQSTLAVAVGGTRVAAAVARRLPAAREARSAGGARRPWVVVSEARRQ